MKLTKVESSNIAGANFLPDTEQENGQSRGTLTIRFVGASQPGPVYQYTVDQWLAEAFFESASKGKFFNLNIRAIKGERLDPKRWDQFPVEESDGS